MQKKSAIRLILAYGMPLALYAFVAWQSWGFDDEIYNIKLVEGLSLGQLFVAVQSDDVHPPLSYIINYLLFHALGSWSLVRVASASFVVLALALFCEQIREQHGRHGWRLAYVGLLLSPSILMWCTSIRWYSYLLPVLAIALILPKRRAGWVYWMTGAAFCVVMSYISYIGLIASAGVLLWRYLNRDISEKHLTVIVVALLLSSLAYLPQVYYLLTVHLHNMGGQVAPLLYSLAGAGLTAFGNHGLFPVSVPAILLLGAWLVFLACNLRLRDFVSREGLPLLAVVILLVASGLSFKYRNALILMPFLFLWVSARGSSDTNLSRMFLGVLIFCTGIGLYHVVTHQSTLKHGWNINYGQVFNSIDELSAGCDEAYVGTFDQVVIDHLKHNEYALVSLGTSAHASDTCFILIDASQSLAESEAISTLIADNPADETLQLSHDDQISIRKMVIPTYLSEGVRIFVYRGADFCTDQCSIFNFYSRRP
ncbi:MAG: hypothetical protein AABY68_13160 [Pseudomonadota bacterium]